MSDPFIGEIKIVGFNFAPANWATCDGQLLPIAQHNALFSLFGTMYGGDGRTTFGLPDLKGRYAMHKGQGAGLSNRIQGAKHGVETNTLSVNQMPTHTHTGTVVSSTSEGDRTDPAGAYPARPEEPVMPYAGTTGGTMAAGGVEVGNAGNGQSVDNMSPFLALNFIVALMGIYPSRP